MKETINGKCVDYTFDGQGIVKNNGKVIFVPGLLKDEEATIEILYQKKDFDVGRIVKINTFSPFRIKPKCPCSTACGGCCFQALDYQEQLKLKFNHASDTLKKIGGISKVISNIYGMEYPYEYRNKIQIPFGFDRQKRIIYGFYKYKSHDIVPIENCAIEDKVHVNILKTIKELMRTMHIDPYNEDTRRGIVRHVLIRHGKVSNETMVVFVVNQLMFPSRKNFVKELVKQNPYISTVVFNLNDRDTNVILGSKEDVVYGSGFIYDTLCGIRFKISSKSFYQVNHDQCEVLYNLAIKEAELKPTDIVLDAYCGIGTIGLIASKQCKTVDGVEIIKEAIYDATNNAKYNGITNAKFVCDDASNYMMNKKYDVVFVDPPRKGLDDPFLKSLLKNEPNKIIYVSCDVATLARDLKLLKIKYDVKSINLVDMFPHTFHVETVALLVLKDFKK
jgi:23S rRNA (uracil1939-C5)-methyltransferase